MHPMLIKRILGESPLFSQFAADEILPLAEKMHANLRRVSKGETIMRAQDAGDASARMYIVLEGALKVTLPQESGDHEVVLNVLTAGAIVGELAMLDGGPRSASVTAMMDSELASLHRSEFYQLTQKYPAMQEKMIRFLCSEVRRLSQRFEQVSTLSVKQRLAAYLLALAKTFKGQPIRMTQQDLSGAVGATREQISRIMKEFYQEGLLEKLETDDSTPKESSPKVAGKHAQVQVTAAGEVALQQMIKEG